MKFRIIAMFMALAAICGIVLAESGEVGSPMWLTVLISIVVAVAYGLIGYGGFLASGSSGFDPVKFATTVIISIIVGLVMVYMGVEATLENAATWTGVIMAQTGVVYYVNKIVSMVINFMKPAPTA